MLQKDGISPEMLLEQVSCTVDTKCRLHDLKSLFLDPNFSSKKTEKAK